MMTGIILSDVPDDTILIEKMKQYFYGERYCLKTWIGSPNDGSSMSATINDEGVWIYTNRPPVVNEKIFLRNRLR